MCSLKYFHAFLLSTAGVDGLELFQQQFQPIHTSGRQQESMTVPKAAQVQLIHTSGRQQESMTIPKAAHKDL
jgi:hypothetical protein